MLVQGVENTRRFLLEWLSFLYRYDFSCYIGVLSLFGHPHRYVPVGVLEQVPQRINQRPPAYVGRDDLETLMASNNCKDWIKIRYNCTQCPCMAPHYVLSSIHELSKFKHCVCVCVCISLSAARCCWAQCQGISDFCPNTRQTLTHE